MNSELAQTGQTALAQANTGMSLFDSGTFEQMGMIALKLAQSSLIPDTLKGKDDEQTAANCFRLVEQAQRWNLSPFAVMDSASVVHGKLMWEGKLIAAAIKSALGVRLRYDYSGEGDHRKVTVSGEIEGVLETIEGTVADWKTTGKNSPWDKLANRDQMLAYRGARQWARRHAPEIILGVYAPDEVDENEMRDANPKTRIIERETTIEPGGPPPSNKRETIEPKGRQKNPRHKVTAQVVGLQGPKSTVKGQEYHVVTLRKSDDNEASFAVFSTTLKDEVSGIPEGELCVFTYTKDSKGRLTLESWETMPDPLDAELSNSEEGIA